VILFCDSSVLVAACVEAHPHFSRAFPLLNDILAGKHKAYAARHSLAEVFSALTTMPVRPRISPADAASMIERNITGALKCVSSTATHYARALARCVATGHSGGVIYDALLLECARSCRAERIYTFNTRHFLALAPDLGSRIVAP
jgi:predicted nucleic acid-binding protein